MKKKTTDTMAADRAALNGLKGIAEALYRHGVMSEEDALAANRRRMEVGAKPLRLERGTFDGSTITPAPQLSPEDIKALREREGASQAVLAMHLGVATATLGQWERGLRRPDGPALRLLSLIDRHGLGYVR